MDLQQLNASFEKTIPSAYALGVRFTEARRGFVRAAVPFEGNGNHFGVLYAGVLFTVAEVLGGAIALTTFDGSKYFGLVKSLTIDFIAPGRTEVSAATGLDDDTVDRIATEAAARGKANFELVAEVTAPDGTLIARTRGDYQIRAFDNFR